MSRDDDKPDRAPPPDGRHERRGGSARISEAKHGFWQRMVDWVAPPGREGEAGAEAPPAPLEALPGVAPPSQETAPVQPREPEAPRLERVAIELILPSGNRTLLLVRAPQDRSGAVLQIYLEPPPANNALIVQALEQGQAVAVRAPEARPALDVTQEPSRRPEPLSAAPPAKPGRAIPGTRTDELVLPAPEAPAPEQRGMRPPTGPEAPAQGWPQPSRAAAPPSALPETSPPPISRPSEPQPTPASLMSPDWRPSGPAAASSRGPSRGGAAREFFQMPQVEEKTARELIVRPASAPADPAGGPPPLAQAPAGQGWAQVPDLPDLPTAPSQPGPQAPALSSQPVKDARAEPPSAQPPAAPVPAPADFPHPSPAPRPDPRRKYLPVVGIDFGTTYSSIAVMRAGIEVIPDETGEFQMPSVVSFPKPGVILVGQEARARMGGEAQWTIASPKRLLGRLHKDPQVANIIGGLAFRTFAGSDKFIRFEAHGQLYSVPDICAMILGKLRERACRFLDAEVSKAVFTVPVSFGTLQRSALELAARQAGLEVVSILTEPSAAVLSYGFRGRGGTVAVYDFGGGTFDFCVLEISETAFQVVCAGGDNWLGGDDFDQALANQLADLFWKEVGVDLRTRAVEWQALLFACEAAKRELSVKKEVEVRLDDLLFTAQGKRGLLYRVARKDFMKLTAPLAEKSIAIADKVLGQAGIRPQKVDAVVLTGGTSLIPMVRDAVSQFFGRKPVVGDPNLAVAKGAALRGAELSGEAIAETSMGGRTLREVAGRTIGAGIQGGRVETLFERSTPLPAEVRHTFYTQADNQTEMVIALYEEAKSRIDQSRTIGHLRYKGLRSAPAGKSRIDFTFLLDEDGILHVSALVEGKQYDKTIKLD